VLEFRVNNYIISQDKGKPQNLSLHLLYHKSLEWM